MTTIAINEVIRLGFACASLVLTRWLLDLASPSEDIGRVIGWASRLFHFARWYGGYECLHQYRAMRLLSYGEVR